MKVIVNGGSADIKVTILKEMDIKILQARVEQMKEVSTMITNAIAENVSIIEIKDEPVIDLPKPPASVENLTATKNT